MDVHPTPHEQVENDPVANPSLPVPWPAHQHPGCRDVARFRIPRCAATAEKHWCARGHPGVPNLDCVSISHFQVALNASRKTVDSTTCCRAGCDFQSSGGPNCHPGPPPPVFSKARIVQTECDARLTNVVNLYTIFAIDSGCRVEPHAGEGNGKPVQLPYRDQFTRALLANEDDRHGCH